MLYLRTMGALSLHEDGPDGPVLIDGSKYLVLLAWLSVAPGKRASRDYLSSLFWPAAERKARFRSLRQCLYSLGKSGAGFAFEADDESVTLDPAALRTDVDDFRQALEARDYEAAIELGRGQFLGGSRGGFGHELSHWIDAENERIRVGVTLAYTETARRHLKAGRAEEAVRMAREYARREPLSEHAQVLLVQALRAAGNDPAALMAYEAYRSLLQDAVGDRPGEELEASVSRVREELLRTPAHPIPDLLHQPALSVETERSRTGGMALAAAAVLAALAIGWAVRGTLRAPGSERWFTALSVRLPVFVGAKDSAVWLEIVDGRARMGEAVDASLRLTESSVLSPDGRLVAEAFEVPLGYDMRLVDRESGEVRSLLLTPADEKPLAWSPDGRYLAFGFGLGSGREEAYWHAIGVYDVAGDSIAFLRESGKESGRTNAAWSPDGTRIAFVTGPESSLEIAVMDADGSNLRLVTAGNVAVSLPIWSPDSRRILFAAGDEGGRDLYSVRPDGAGLTRLTDLRDVETPYAWPAPDRALFFRGPPKAGRPWALNPVTRSVREIEVPEGETYDPVSHLWTMFERPPWVQDVSVRGLSGELAVGSRARLDLEGRTAGGEPVRVDPSSIRWDVSDSAVVRVAGDTLLVLSEGPFRLIGSAGGWRADTVESGAAAMMTVELEPALDEDWSAGIDTTRWVPVGDPRPYASREGGPDSAGIFRNNGDRNFMSGVFTRRSFSLGEGLTLEAWGRMPFDGNHWQSYTLRLLDPETARAHLNPEAAWASEPLDQLRLAIDFNGFDTISKVSSEEGDTELPWPAPTDEWRLYTVQVEPDGFLCVWYGGELVLRMPDVSGLTPADSVLVGIGGTSSNATVEHGRLRVYEGVKHRLE